jgi:hypothetical protein
MWAVSEPGNALAESLVETVMITVETVIAGIDELEPLGLARAGKEPLCHFGRRILITGR